MTECGLACVAMLTDYHERPASLRYLRNKYPVRLESGLSLFELSKIAETSGLVTRVVAFDNSELTALQTPSILHWGNNHFVILEQSTARDITIVDPAFGRRKLRMDEASEYISGYAIEVTPNGQKPKSSGDLNLLGIAEFARALAGVNTHFITILVCGVLLQVFVLAAPSYVKLVVDEAIQNNSTELLLSFVVLFGVVYLFETIYKFLTDWLRNILTVSLSNKLTNSNITHLLNLPFQYFANRYPADILARVGSADKVSEFLTNHFIGALLAVVGCLFSIILMFYYDVILALISLSGLAVFSIFRIMLYGPLRRYTAEEVACRADADGRLLEMTEGIFSTKLFNLSSPLSNLWARSFNQSLRAQRKKENYRITFDTLSQAILHIEQLLVVAWAGYRIINGEATVGAAYAYIQYKNIFGDNFIKIFNALLERNVALVHVDRMADIIQSEPEIRDDTNKLPATVNSVGCRNVTVSFPGRYDSLLEGVSLSVKRGETAVFVGKTGAGKSTLLSVLSGLIPAESGTLLINGVEVDQTTASTLRHRVATVTPKDGFFSGTLRENITTFEGFVDEKRFVNAIDTARIANRIKDLDHFENTEFSIARHILSTGELQRLLIARALYRNPDILYLDEFTANLDADTASKIWLDIKRLPCIKLVATHRKDIIDTADVVYRVGEGKVIVEREPD